VLFYPEVLEGLVFKNQMIVKLFKNYFLCFTISFCVVVSVATLLNFVEGAFFQKAEAKDINSEVVQVSEYLERGCVGAYHQPAAAVQTPRLPEVGKI